MVARQKSPNPCGTVIVIHPAITNITPSAGAVGATVTITGTNFGSVQSSVTFNGVAATSFSNWSATSISVVVPTGATTGPVVVTVGGQPSNGFNFTVGAAPSLEFTSYIAHGDSITAGGGGVQGSYASIMQTMLDPHPPVAQFNNRGQGGASPFEGMDRVYAINTPDAGLPLYSIFHGTNFAVNPGETAPGDAFRNVMAAGIAWMAIPTFFKLHSRTGSVTYSVGHWTDHNVYNRIDPLTPPGNAPVAISRVTTTNGATATFTLTGSILYIFMQKWAYQDTDPSTDPPNNGACEIWVDGVKRVEHQSAAPVWSIRSINTYDGKRVQNSPWWIRIANLNPGVHNVEIRVTSPTNPDNKVAFDWAAGLSGTQQFSPRVYALLNWPRVANMGLQELYDPSYQNKILIDLANELRADGLIGVRGPVPIPPDWVTTPNWDGPNQGGTVFPDLYDELHPSFGFPGSGQDKMAINLYNFITTDNLSVAAPVITSVSPSTAAEGSTITINGTHFGTAKGQVKFGDFGGVPVSWSDTQIVATIPMGAITGDVIVTTHGQASNGQSIIVQPMSLAFTSYAPFGDSITQGTGYPTAIRDHFSLASAYDMRAMMGITSFEMLDRVYWLTVPSTGLPLYTTLIGTNNFPQPGSTPAGLLYRHSLAAALAWIAIPSSYPQRVNGRDTTKVTYTGTWTDQTNYARLYPMTAGGFPDAGPPPPWTQPWPQSNTQPAPIGKYTTEHAATAKFKISGSVIYIFFTKWSKLWWYAYGLDQDDWFSQNGSYWGEPPNGAWCSISIDDSAPVWYSSGAGANFPDASIASISGYGPPWGAVNPHTGNPARHVQNTSWWIRLDGLSLGEHDVELVSWTNGGNPGSNPADMVSFEWAVGLPVLPSTSINNLPRVYPIPVLPRFDGGNPYDLTYMYELFSEVVNTLRGDGLTNIRGPMPIIPLDLATHFDFYTPPHDPIHPNAAGQAKIAADVLAFINGRG